LSERSSLLFPTPWITWRISSTDKGREEENSKDSMIDFSSITVFIPSPYLR
jgi:hypothetical protein